MVVRGNSQMKITHEVVCVANGPESDILAQSWVEVKYETYRTLSLLPTHQTQVPDRCT